MKQEIIDQMTAIAASMDKWGKSDFENHDKLTIEANNDEYPQYLWVVHKDHTYLIDAVEYVDMFQQYESVRYDFVRGVLPGTYELTTRDDHKVYSINCDGVKEITFEKARAILKLFTYTAMLEWEKAGNKLPVDHPVDLVFQHITFSQLKALLKDCEVHGDTSLRNIFKRFKNYPRYSDNHKIHISYDKQCNEFSFWADIDGKIGVNGGIIFHGWPETGYLTNGSIQLSPKYGWASHT